MTLSLHHVTEDKYVHAVLSSPLPAPLDHHISAYEQRVHDLSPLTENVKNKISKTFSKCHLVNSTYNTRVKTYDKFSKAMDFELHVKMSEK